MIGCSKLIRINVAFFPNFCNILSGTPTDLELEIRFIDENTAGSYLNVYSAVAVNFSIILDFIAKVCRQKNKLVYRVY